MEIGVAFPASTTLAEPVALAESVGYTHAWFDDSQMLFSDPYISMALSAERTSTISLGVGVTNPSTRIAPVTANAIATVNRLAPGRVRLGIGTGNTALRTMGLPAARVADLAEHVDVVRALLTGGVGSYRRGDQVTDVTFLSPDDGWIDISTPIPIFIAGSGPRVLELAGERGDGVILFGTVDPELLRTSVERIRVGARRAGREVEDIPIMVMTAFCLLADGEDSTSKEAIAKIGPFVQSATNLLALSNPDPRELPAHLRDDLMVFRNIFKEPPPDDSSSYSGYATGVRADVAARMTDAVIRATTLTGTADEIRASIAAMEEAGVGLVSIRPVVDIPGTIRSFAEVARPMLG